MENTLRLSPLILAVALFGGGFRLAMEDRPGVTVATYSAAIVCLIFAFLSRFRSFSGLGIKAEMWEQKMQEAAQIIDKLKGLSVAVAAPLFTMCAQLRDVSRRERINMIEQVERVLSSNGVSKEEIETAKEAFHQATLVDLAEAVTVRIFQVLDQKDQVASEDMKKWPVIHPQHQRAVSDKSAIGTARQNLRAVALTRPAEQLSFEIRHFLNSCEALMDQEKSELIERTSTAMADLEHYAKTHTFLHFEEWMRDTRT